MTAADIGAHDDAYFAASRRARRRSRTPRLALAAAIAALSAVWVGWWAIVWLTALLVAEYAVEPWLRRRFAIDRADTRARALLLRLFMATLYALSWAPALAIAGAQASVFSFCVLAGALIHSLVHFATTPTQFMISIAPPVTLAVSTSLIFHWHEIWAWLFIPALGILVWRAALARGIQASMQRQLVEDRVSLEASEAASRAKSLFLANMTHELRTPLNAIINFAEMVQENIEDHRLSEVASDAGRIRAAGLHLLAIVDTTLDYALVDSGNVILKRATFDIRAVVAATSEKYKSHLRIDTSIDENLGTIIGDPDRVAQCCDAIVANAARFAPRSPLHIHGATELHGPGALVHLDFQDEGPGIGPALSARIFEPMAQIDPSKTRPADGVGMGLALTRKLARAMGGDCVLLKSEVGVGSTFRLTLAQAPEGWPA